MLRELPPIEPLPYPELWVLERCIEDRYELPASQLLDSHDARWNAHPHDLDAHQLAKTFWKLWTGKLIEFVTGRWNDRLKAPTCLAEIEAWFDPEPKDGANFRITEAGVARWERHAMPDWDRFVAYWDVIESDNRQVIGPTIWTEVAATEEFARRFLDNEIRARSLGLIEALWDQARVEHFVPFRAMLGKTLPHGVRLTVPVMNYGYPMDLAEWPPQIPLPDWEISEAQWQKRVELFRWYANGTGQHPDRPVTENCVCFKQEVVDDPSLQ